SEIERLRMPPLSKVPPVESVAITALEQNVRVYAIFDHIGSAPFAGDHRVATQMPPEVVGQILRSPIRLPFPHDIEALGIHREDAARPIPTGRSQRTPVDTVGPAVDSVGRRVTGTRGEFLRLDHLHDFRVCWVGLGVDDMNPRGADAWNDQVAALHVRMRS